MTKDIVTNVYNISDFNKVSLYPTRLKHTHTYTHTVPVLYPTRLKHTHTLHVTHLLHRTYDVIFQSRNKQQMGRVSRWR